MARITPPENPPGQQRAVGRSRLRGWSFFGARGWLAAGMYTLALAILVSVILAAHSTPGIPGPIFWSEVMFVGSILGVPLILYGLSCIEGWGTR